MDNFTTQEETTTQSKVKFSLTPDGKLEFDCQGLQEWEVTNVIEQITSQANKQLKTQKLLAELANTRGLLSHCLALGFMLFTVGGCSFTVSRLASTHFQQPTTQQLAQ